jgi:hypothetical protein
VKAVEKIATIFDQLKTDAPELRAALVGLVGYAEAVGGDIAVDSSADGLNVTADLATLKAAADLITYFRTTVLPIVEQVYGQVKTDTATTVAASPAPAAPPVPAALIAAAQPGPGLHAVTAG